ncbi:MAG: phosphoribosylglycinamide formyltransferase [Candidatus Omnitrophica bacterium]|nr:phosphoribosylglycinamide formyltransferase [Candidatus Omnitrophota bacterium]MCM8826005.1 phosphoribosylglycinamide formyltransferase [Candidatus Omnitrophota bacterium]
MINIAVLASGRGTNFEAIVKAIKSNYLKANLKVLITDKKNAYVRIRARTHGIREVFIDPKRFNSPMDFEKETVKILKEERVKLVVLAGFMRVLSPYFVNLYRKRILNIHPSLLPAFKGKSAIERAYKYGVKVTGVTVHFVDRKVDNGPIILQESLKIKDDYSLEELEENIHRIEHRLYPKAIKLVIDGKLKIKGRRVIVEKF